MNNCCYCKQTVENEKEGFISKNINFHHKCLKEKFKKKAEHPQVPEHIIFYE